MTFKILVTNQKGGVGKSTIAANLAAYLAMQNSGQVHLIDFDRQSSSSKWVYKAPDIGLKVHQVHLDFRDTGSLILAEAKRHLNKLSVGCEISISDLTWTYSMSPEFMLEYDLILVPSSLSKFEMASSEIFILEYVQEYLIQIGQLGQEILIVPSRVDINFEPQQSFLNVKGLKYCSLTPPIFQIPEINDFIYEDFLCVSTNANIANTFSTFGKHLTKIIDTKIAAKKLFGENFRATKRPSGLSVLDKYRIERKHQSEKKDASLFEWLPDFLIKKVR